jgi:cytochrome c1
LAQFVTLLYAEQQAGHEAAAAEMRELMRPVALAEPPPESLAAAGAGQPLIAATDELYYRRKAAAVWWMLRSITSDDSLQAALTAYRLQPVSTASASEQAIAFERLLEKTSHKDLAWFFADWVLNDRGLPDLTITDVTPRPLPAGKGHDSGWLVAVTVHNDGAAAAQVPLVVRSGTYSVSRTMRIPGLSSATERVLVEAQPTQVVLNDGNTPEVINSQHSVNVKVQRQ